MKKIKLILKALCLVTSFSCMTYSADICARNTSNSFGSLELHGINGNAYDVTSQQSDTVNVVFFSTTWCCHCPYVCETLTNLAAKLKGQKVRFFYVLIGHESDAQVKAHFNTSSSNIVVYKAMSSLKLEGINSVPCCIVFDKNGNEVFRHAGKRDYNTNDFKKFLMGLAKATPSCLAKGCNSNSTCYKIPEKIGSKVKNDKARANSARKRSRTLSRKGKADYRKNSARKRS